MVTDDILDTGAMLCPPNHTHPNMFYFLKIMYNFSLSFFLFSFSKSHVISMYIKLYKENKASQAFWYKYNQHL